jgi:squalene-associated FAD-dependent desaturase
MQGRRRVGIVGGGWAGLAAAVEASRRGAQVSLFEMAPQLGGRAREIVSGGLVLDNGQHICIGAYSQTLRLLRTIGVSEASAFLRTRLRLVDAHGAGLRLGKGPPFLAFMRAVARHPAWDWRSKFALTRLAGAWLLARFRCVPGSTVADLTRALPRAVREEFIDPLCIAALNTPAGDASGEVFLRVLRDALFAGQGSADLLLPRISLGEVLPAPAARWLAAAGAEVRLRHRVDAVEPDGASWQIDGHRFDGVVLAASPLESARLARPVNPAWADAAAALRYEPIVTVYLRSEGAALPEPMLALRPGAERPAQFVFDRGQLGGPAGLMAFVISGAQPWVQAGAERTVEAIRGQAEATLRPWLQGPLETVRILTERRATIRCTPALRRPGMAVGPNLMAAGDHVESPYPSTLEGAIRSGVAAANGLVS